MSNQKNYLSLTDYPEEFYRQVFDLFIKYFGSPKEDKEDFAYDYHNNIIGNAYIVVLNAIEFSFYIPNDDNNAYPHLHITKQNLLKLKDIMVLEFVTNTIAKVALINLQIKELVDRYMKLAVYL